ncbi:MAG: hypothetical protein HON76_14545 [Candidatus Scalindua sp.]|jgi:hypothetical protein|nr:hypothetical protein [Candidatus Scalindua sp.]MBT6229424.1 hypothetical protein [Candidatus Scalindua sp.]MBT6563736.1 hypothetical protein [Candidatus Scalindua sp.]
MFKSLVAPFPDVLDEVVFREVRKKSLKDNVRFLKVGGNTKSCQNDIGNQNNS